MLEFTPTLRISREDFKQDKIDLSIGYWIASGVDDGILSFVNYLACDNRRDDQSIPEEQLGWIFNRPSGQNRTRTLAIRTDSHERAGAKPLFSGKLTLESRSNGFERRSAARLRVDLHTNPTRYLLYQTLPDSYEEGPEAWLLQPEIRAIAVGHKQSGTRRRIRERPLDRQPYNFLPLQEWEVFGRPAVWYYHVERYLSSITDSLEREFCRCAEIAGLSVSRHSEGLGFMLKEVENYIDFSPPNQLSAVEYVAQIAPYITAYRNSRISDYDINHDTQANEHYSKSVTLELRKGVRLKIYAKTRCRIRFEITYAIPQCTTLIHSEATRSCRSRRASSIRQILQQLQNLTRDSERRLNCFFEFLLGRLYPPSDQLPAYVFVSRLTACLGDMRHVEDLLPALIENSSITLKHPDPLFTQVNALVQAGLMMRADTDGNRCRTFTVSPPFVQALRHLQDDPSRIMIRRRRRL